MTDLIGITGRAGSGKSTAADVLLKAGWARVKFADPLKNMLRAIGLSDRHIEGDLKEVPCDLLQGKTPRWAMQSLGTEWGRQCIGEGLWLDLARREIALTIAQGVPVVVDDVRFENEAQLIRDLGGTILQITRGNAETPSHASEADLAGDIVYRNNGTRAELQGFIRYVWLMSGE